MNPFPTLNVRNQVPLKTEDALRSTYLHERYSGRPVPAAVALQRARAKLASGKSEFAPYPSGVTWQPAARRTRERLAYVERPETNGFRHVGNVEAESHGGRDSFSNRDTCGWYTDPDGFHSRDGTGLLWGVVYQLPGRGGRSRFVAGYQNGGTDGGPVLDLGTIFESEREEEWNPQNNPAAREAARAADSMAQYAAEEEREYQEAWQAGQRAAELEQEASEARAAALADLKTRKAVRADMFRVGVPLESREWMRTCAMFRERVERHLETIREAREKRDKLKSEIPARLMSAFEEGLG